MGRDSLKLYNCDRPAPFPGAEFLLFTFNGYSQPPYRSERRFLSYFPICPKCYSLPISPSSYDDGEMTEGREAKTLTNFPYSLKTYLKGI
jgi:hypothetical protein